MRHIKLYKIFESSQELTKEQVEFLNKYTEGSWRNRSWRNSHTTGLVDVDGDFNCSYKSLEDFKGIRFGKIGGNFYCHGNNLTSLEGAPESVGVKFYCFNNELTSLEGAPRTIGGDFLSDGLEIPKGKWGLETFIDLLKSGTSKQQQLVAPLVDLKVLQQQIDENPEGMLVKLKGVLKHPHLQGLKWPQRLEQEKDLLSDLGDVGL